MTSRGLETGHLAPAPPVTVSRHNGVAVVTLNRPARRNAVNLAMATAIIDAITANRDERAIVITGADPAFCAGMDLRDLGTDSLADLPPFLPAIAGCPIPVIAAVNGPAVTAGLEIALMCDFIVASEDASFADTHLRVGVYPGPVAVELPRRVGVAQAREILLTNGFVDAETALRIGLVNRVVAHGDVVRCATERAAAIAENDPAMVALLRAQLNESASGSLEQARDIHARYKSRASSLTTSAQLAGRHADVIARSRGLRAHAQPGEEPRRSADD
jgi:enoyl-CoA hydratase/carnithine racemase